MQIQGNIHFQNIEPNTKGDLLSIFSKQIENIVFDDIKELLDEKVPENIRLEYKWHRPPTNSVCVCPCESVFG